MKQRIAFIVCGQPRHISLYEEYMSKMLFEFDHEIDFFFHFWGENDNKILDTLKPKKYIFEPQKDFSEYINTFDKKNKSICNYRPISNFVSYSYSTKKAFELKDQYELKNNFEYDLVFRIRFDVMALNTLVFKESRLDYFKKNINCTDNIRFFPVLNHQKMFGMGDLINFSSSKIMRLFNNIYDDIYDSFNNPEYNYIQQSRHKWYCGESWLANSFYRYIIKNNMSGININLFIIPFLLKRSDPPHFKITQDFVYNFNNNYPNKTII